MSKPSRGSHRQSFSVWAAVAACEIATPFHPGAAACNAERRAHEELRLERTFGRLNNPALSLCSDGVRRGATLHGGDDRFDGRERLDEPLRIARPQV
jgi:hypothetical protein